MGLFGFLRSKTRDPKERLQEDVAEQQASLSVIDGELDNLRRNVSLATKDSADLNHDTAELMALFARTMKFSTGIAQMDTMINTELAKVRNLGLEMTATEVRVVKMRFAAMRKNLIMRARGIKDLLTNELNTEAMFANKLDEVSKRAKAIEKEMSKISADAKAAKGNGKKLRRFAKSLGKHMGDLVERSRSLEQELPTSGNQKKNPISRGTRARNSAIDRQNKARSGQARGFGR